MKDSNGNRLDPGDKVSYHSIIGGPVTSSGHVIKDLYVMFNEETAKITGKSAIVSCESLTKEEEQ